MSSFEAVPSNIACVDVDIVLSILNLPLARRTEVERRDIIMHERPTPKLSIEQKDGKKVRTFNFSWYDVHKWLCGSFMKNRLFCWPCLLFSNRKCVWSCEGYYDLKNMSASLKKHSICKDHISNSLSFKDVQKRAFSVYNLVNEQSKIAKIRYNEEVKINREIIRKLIALTCTLAKQELAFRGHDESEASLNPGNFKALWELLLNSNPKLKDHWNKKNYFKGLSKTIQNELIDLIKDEITIFIENAINNAPFFACIVDETTDITEKAQCSIVCRLVDAKGAVQEYFLGFFDLGEERNAPALRDLLFGFIGKFYCQNKLVAQTYDGASVMSGQLNGLQKLVRDSAPLAMFTHCFAHRLNLVLQQSCSNITSVKIFFSTL